MLYTVLPGLSLCMTILSNTTNGPEVNIAFDESEVDYHYTEYLDAAMILIKAAKKQRKNEAMKEPLMEIELEKENIDRQDIASEDNYFEDLKPNIQSQKNEKLEEDRCSSKPIDCEDLLVECGFSTSGIYRIWPRSRIKTAGDAGFDVYCDMETDGGGWTVIQRRDDFGSNSDFFYKDWNSYKNGFGDLKMDFWLGNDKIFALSNQRPTTLRFDLYDFDGEEGTAQYSDFYIDDESERYRLHIGDYRGNVGDSFVGHNLCRFSALDRDNDNSNIKHCATMFKGGWWYNDCHTTNLNGIYHRGAHTTYADGINWHGWRGFRYSLKKTEMKLRSSDFRVRNDADYMFGV